MRIVRAVAATVAVSLLTVLIGATEVRGLDHLRVNQLGYAPADPKIGRLLARTDRQGTGFRIVRVPDETLVFEGTVGPTRGAWGDFAYSHTLDFTLLEQSGVFEARIPSTGERSVPFAVGPVPYGGIASALLEFFAAQRCGDTDPALHDVCHLLDATRIDGGPDAGEAVPLSRGWHDAGDYLKFLTTASFATHLLLWTEEIRPGVAGDRDGDGVSDLLEEAAIGARWLLRLRYRPGRFLYQVQDERDHAVGWRMPEDDPLTPDRPAFWGAGKNHLGRHAAALARAARAFAAGAPTLADSCRIAAEDAYAAAASAPPIGSGSFYADGTWRDKMALGAVELYLTTGGAGYLADARAYADAAGPGYWFSWGDLNGLAHALLAPFHPPSLANLEQDLIAFDAASQSHPWGMAGTETWGTSMMVAGAALEALLFERLTGRTDYLAMAFAQRDFLFGTNPWGVCFAGGLGAVSPADFHHQVADLVNGGALPGAMTEGPAPRSVLIEQGIVLDDPDEYLLFQAERGVYHDDRGDWVTNEPTLTANATACMLAALFDARAATPGSLTEAPVRARFGINAAPNPFATETALRLAGTAAPPSLDVYNVQGERIARVLLGPDGAGVSSGRWDGRTQTGRPAPPGVYLVRFAGGPVARLVRLR